MGTRDDSPGHVDTAEAIARELRAQSAFLKTREPVYDRALDLFEHAVRGELGERLERLWAGRTFNSGYERPLLLLAAVRYDALCEGPVHPLYEAFVEHPVRADALTADAFAAAISPARSRFERAVRDRFVQTNETTRAVTWLWPAHLLHAAGVRRPLALVDLGTSAGLNLVADGLPSVWVDERDRQIPTAPRLPVALRLGLDVAPLDVCQDDDANWLRACVWPSDRFRLDRLESAIALFRSARSRDNSPVLEACHLGDAPARLASLPGDRFVLCTQTIVRDYVAPEERARYEDGMRAFLIARPCAALLVELEVDLAHAGTSEDSAAMVAHFAVQAGDLHALPLARTHPHPRRLLRDAAALGTLAAAFRANAPQI